MNERHHRIRRYKIAEAKKVLATEIRIAKLYRNGRRTLISGKEHYDPGVIVKAKEEIERVASYIRLWNQLLHKPDHVHLKNYEKRYHAVIIDI